jgi:hypothetical protein
MLARALVAALGLILPAAVAHAEAQLVIGAVVVKSARFSVQGSRLEVRSNSREGVMLTFSSADPVVWTSSIVLPGGVQSLDLRALRLPSWPAQIVATPL